MLKKLAAAGFILVAIGLVLLVYFNPVLRGVLVGSGVAGFGSQAGSPSNAAVGTSGAQSGSGFVRFTSAGESLFLLGELGGFGAAIIGLILAVAASLGGPK